MAILWVVLRYTEIPTNGAFQDAFPPPLSTNSLPGHGTTVPPLPCAIVSTSPPPKPDSCLVTAPTETQVARQHCQI